MEKNNVPKCWLHSKPQQNASAPTFPGADRSHSVGANEIDCRWTAHEMRTGRFVLSCGQRSARRGDDRRNARPRYFLVRRGTNIWPSTSQSPAKIGARLSTDEPLILAHVTHYLVDHYRFHCRLVRARESCRVCSHSGFSHDHGPRLAGSIVGA